LLNRSRYEIKGKTKSLIVLRWNWNTLNNPDGAISLARKLNLVEFVSFNSKISCQNESYKLILEKDALIASKQDPQ